MSSNQWGRSQGDESQGDTPQWPSTPQPPEYGQGVAENADKADPTSEFPEVGASSSWGSAPVASAPEKKRRGGRILGAVVVVLALLIGAGVASYFFWLRPAWQDGDATIADQFPSLVSDRQNGEGWEELSCEHRDPAEDQQARIVCSDDDVSLVIIDFGEESVRDSYVPSTGRTTMESDRCSVDIAEVSGNDNPTQAVIPTDEGARQYGLLLSAEDADDVEELLTAIPVC